MIGVFVLRCAVFKNKEIKYRMLNFKDCALKSVLLLSMTRTLCLKGSNNCLKLGADGEDLKTSISL